MFPPLVILFAGILGGAALVYFWDDILEWLHDLLQKVSRKIREIAKQFGSTFEHIAYIIADKIDSIDAKIEHYLYHKRHDGQYEEIVTRRTLPASQLPSYAKRKIEMKRRGQIEEADITKELELETGCSVS